jgi:low temperature requirement protein LtrA
VSSPPAPRSVRVSTLELFFDLVFVFTITQLTEVLAEGHDLEALGRVVVMLLLIWWIYDGYAWLTNAIATDRLRFRLLLIGGMGGFLVIALAAPHAYEGDGLTFGLGYLAVIALHAGMFVRGASVDEVRAILRIAPFNLLASVMVVVGGALGGDAQTIIWALAGILLWLTPRFTTVEGFVLGVAHFVERHGLVVIVALGESIVVIGVGAEGLELDAGLVLVALFALALNAALWWVYFSDETAVEEAFHAAAPERRAQLRPRTQLEAADRGRGRARHDPARHRRRRRRAGRGARGDPRRRAAGERGAGEGFPPVTGPHRASEPA